MKLVGCLPPSHDLWLVYDSQKLNTVQDLDASGGVHVNVPSSAAKDVRSTNELLSRKNDLKSSEELPVAYVVSHRVIGPRFDVTYN